MSLAKEITKCPYCKEPIAAGAIRCKHCHADLVKQDDRKGSRLVKYNNFRIGFLCGIVFAIVIFVLGYFQFSGGD